MTYFSDRENGMRNRTLDYVPETAWGGLYSAIERRINDGTFGYGCPLGCPDDTTTVCGCDREDLKLRVLAEIPTLQWPLNLNEQPLLLDLLDLLELLFSLAGKPTAYEFHSYFRHQHFQFDTEAGRAEFRQEINRIFARNGVAFELNASGQIERLVPIVFEEGLRGVDFSTGDKQLDLLLSTSVVKYVSPDTTQRSEALEKLWDAWERLKTIEDADKKASITKLLDLTVTEPEFRQLIETEATTLTKVGNQFHIRHFETDKTPITDDLYIDYLFHRMFSLIYLILKKTNRLSAKLQAEHISEDKEIPF